jgi:hypothetical protein
MEDTVSYQLYLSYNWGIVSVTLLVIGFIMKLIGTNPNPKKK